MSCRLRSVRVRVTLSLMVCALALCGLAVHASDQAIAITRFQASIHTSTSLRVSDERLVIVPQPAGQIGPIVAGTIEFRAAARTSSDGEVLLTVEPLASITTLSGGASDGVTSVEFQGSGDGAQSGALHDASPEAAARWTGSGMRMGRLTFIVRGPVAPQGATLPLRFVLSAP
jgi:hypothetical protein